MIVFQDLEIYQLADDMTDEAFYEFCVANRDLRIERDADKKIIIIAPVNSESGFYEGKVFSKLDHWNDSAVSRGVTFSPSTGYQLPNGATRAADASWIRLERWHQLTEQDKKRFLPIVPDFAIEIRSKTDKLKELKSKLPGFIFDLRLLRLP